MDKMLWVVLDTIRDMCTKRDYCEGCPCAGETTDRYYCAIDGEPSHWQTDIIRNNLEKRAESEGAE